MLSPCITTAIYSTPSRSAVAERQYMAFSVKSLGMLCGGSELGLTDADYEGADVDGILILKPDTKVGVDINEILGRTDVILDVSVTANRPEYS